MSYNLEAVALVLFMTTQCEQCGNALPNEEWMVTVTKDGHFCSHNCYRLFYEDVAVTKHRLEPDEWFGQGIFGQGTLELT